MVKTFLRHQGKVLSYADYLLKNGLSETVKFELSKTQVGVQLDSSCVEAVWDVIQSECAGNVENLMRYLAKGTDVVIGTREIIKHIMNLLDEHLNNDVVIIKGHQHIKNLDDFIHKGMKLDYVSCVETLADRLFGNEDSKCPKYVNLIMDIIKSDTDVDCGDEFEEEEEE